MRNRGWPSVALLSVSALTGCQSRGDADVQRRHQWVQQQTQATNRNLLEYLNRAGDIEFVDGWYPVESDPKTGGAWRWMSGRGITRLASRPGGRADVTDMELKIFGWGPHEHLGVLPFEMEFSVNGHVLGRFVPPKGSFEHVIVVPRYLLERSSHVDFVITVTNAAHPNGDARELGFATTGFHWTPAPVT